MTVHVESHADEQSLRDHAAQELSQQVKAYVGVSVQVNVGRPGSIERSLGKAKHVIDKRNLHAR